MNKPYLILAVSIRPTPETPKDFYDAGKGPLYQLIKNPPYLRRYGWNLETLSTPQLKGGSAWRIQSGERKLIQLANDGTFVVFGSLDDHFLGWGNEQKESQKTLNTLAIIEFVYEFAATYKKIISLLFGEEGENTIELQFLYGISNPDNETIRLKPYEINSSGYMFDGFGEKFELKKEFEKGFTLKSFISTDYDSEKIAHKIIVHLFREFAVPDNLAPYSKTDENGETRVDIDKIKGIK